MSRIQDFFSVIPAGAPEVQGLTAAKPKAAFLDRGSLTFPISATVGSVIVQLVHTGFPTAAVFWISVAVALLLGAFITAVDFARKPNPYPEHSDKLIAIGIAFLNSLLLAAAFLGIGAVGETITPS